MCDDVRSIGCGAPHDKRRNYVPRGRTGRKGERLAGVPDGVAVSVFGVVVAVDVTRGTAVIRVTDTGRRYDMEADVHLHIRFADRRGPSSEVAVKLGIFVYAWRIKQPNRAKHPEFLLQAHRWRTRTVEEIKTASAA